MKKSNQSILAVCAVLGAVLLLVSVVLQFIPFWDVGTDTASVAGYVWWPKGHAALTEAIADQCSGFDLNQIVLAPVVQLVCGVVGVVFCIWQRHTPVPYIFTGLSGLVGIYGCLHPAFRLGGIWPLFLVLDLLLVLITIVGVGVWINKSKTEPKRVAYI